MAELKRLKGYSGQSTDALIALDAEYSAESILKAFGQALNAKDMDQLTEAEGVVCAVAALERQLADGGFLDFFERCPEWTPHVVAALELVGRADVGRVVAKAFAAIGVEPDADIDVLEAAISEPDEVLEDALEDCDDEYAAVAADLASDVLAFIKRERGNIRLGAR